MYPGIADRIQKELTALAPAGFGVRLNSFDVRLYGLKSLFIIGQDCSAPRTREICLDWRVDCSLS
jgi:hypothetical protein